MRKTFKYTPVTKIELTSEIIDGKRWYTIPGGTKVKSVTTILSEKLDKTGLIEWRNKVGEEEANKISTQAARRGTAIHGIAERYVLNEENYTSGEMPVNIDTFNKIRPILDQHVDNIIGVEFPLYSKLYKAAGRTDLIAEYNGITSIIDFKTSRKNKKEEWIESYFLQTTIYALMFEQLYKIPTPQIVIIIAVDHELPQIYVCKKEKYIDRVLEIFGT